MRIKLIIALCLLSCLLLTVPTGATAEARGNKQGSGKETFSALAVLPAAGPTANVTIYIESCSSAQDAQALQGALTDGGPDVLLKALEKMKSIGRIERVGTVSFYDFRFIRSVATPTGRRIIAVTDRPIGFLEAYFSTRSMDYKFGILQLDLKDDKKGREEGEGTLIYAARIKALAGDKFEIENYGIDPIRLQGVRQL
jgi:hypothetical protein